MTRGPIQLDVGISYGLSRRGLPAPTSLRRWVAAALAGRIRRADLAVRLDEIERESLRQAINHLLDEGEGKEVEA